MAQNDDSSEQNPYRRALEERQAQEPSRAEMADNPYIRAAAEREAAIPKPGQNTNGLQDFGTGLKQGVLNLPSDAAGFLDMAAAAVGYDRPVANLAQAAADATGFRPAQWAQEMGQRELSPGYSASERAKDAVWNDPNAGLLEKALVTAQNLGPTAVSVAQSIPGMFAGGAAGKVLGGALKLAGPARGALGEGMLMSGGAMADIDPNVDAQTAAASAAGIGLLGGGVGLAGARVAKALGVGDVDTFAAGGGRAVADAAKEVPATMLGKAGEYAGRVAKGAISEGVFEEAPQTAIETALTNYAEDKPLTEGLARNVVEGALAGGLMGGAFNLIPQRDAPAPLPPPDSPLSRAAAAGGLNPITGATPAAETAGLTAGLNRQNDADAAASRINTGFENPVSTAGLNLVSGESAAPRVDEQGVVRRFVPPAQLTEVDAAAYEAAPSPTNDRAEPTLGQAEAGNYKKGQTTLAGLALSFENPAGSVRRDKENAEPTWQTELQDHYGYIKGVPARAPDGDAVDVFVKPGTPKAWTGPVFVIDQSADDGSFDEPKLIMGAADATEAQQMYARNYEPGFAAGRVLGVTALDLPQLKVRLSQPGAFMAPQPDTQAPDVQALTYAPDALTAAKPPAEKPLSQRDNAFPDPFENMGSAPAPAVDTRGPLARAAGGAMDSGTATGAGPQFESYTDARDYVSQARRNNATVVALPVARDDGSYGVAIKGSPEYAQAYEQATARNAGMAQQDQLRQNEAKKAAEFAATQAANDAAQAAKAAKAAEQGKPAPIAKAGKAAPEPAPLAPFDNVQVTLGGADMFPQGTRVRSVTTNPDDGSQWVQVEGARGYVPLASVSLLAAPARTPTGTPAGTPAANAATPAAPATPATPDKAANVSSDAGVQSLLAAAPGGGGLDGAPGLATDVGLRGAGGRALEQPAGQGAQPAAGAVPPRAGQPGASADAALSPNAQQALTSIEQAAQQAAGLAPAADPNETDEQRDARAQMDAALQDLRALFPDAEAAPEAASSFGAAPAPSPADLADPADLNDLNDLNDPTNLNNGTQTAQTFQGQPQAPSSAAAQPDTQTAADAAGLSQAPAPAPATADLGPLVDYTTQKGKVLRGVMRDDLTADQAKAADPYTMQVEGAWFVREKNLPRLQAVLAGQDPDAAPAALPAAGATPAGALPAESALKSVPFLDKMPAGQRGWTKYDERAQEARQPFVKPISDVPDSAGEAFTAERMALQAARSEAAARDLDGKLRSDNRTGASVGQLMDSWVQWNQASNSLAQLSQQDPAAFGAYQERQQQVQALQPGDKVLAPFPTPGNPLGSEYTVDRKFAKNWRLKDEGGTTVLVPPSALRPVAQVAQADGQAAPATTPAAAAVPNADVAPTLAQAVQARAQLAALSKDEALLTSDDAAQRYLDAADARGQADASLAKLLAERPDEGFALSAQTSDGRSLMLTASAQQPGMWQLTRLDKAGEPWGDTQYPTKAQAVSEMLGEADLSTLADGSGVAVASVAAPADNTAITPTATPPVMPGQGPATSVDDAATPTATATDTATAAAPATPPAGLAGDNEQLFPNRKLGFKRARVEPADEYNDQAWANIAASNMKPGDTFSLGGKSVTVTSVTGKTLKLQGADGKTRTLNPDGVAWAQFQRDLGGQLTAENLQANNILNPARPLLDIFKRDPAVQTDERGSVFMRQPERKSLFPAVVETPASEAARTKALSLADQLEAAGADKSFIAGVRTSANNRAVPYRPEALGFIQQRLDERLALQGKGPSGPVRENNTLDRWFTQDSERARLSASRADPVLQPVLAEADKRLSSLGELINASGATFEGVNATTPDARLRDAKRLMTSLAGQASRLMNKGEAVRKGYKRADPAVMQQARAELQKDLAKIDAFLAAAPSKAQATPAPAAGLPTPAADGKGRAAAGGQEGVNGYLYKGGQFLPNTMAEPGKWKVKGKWVTSGRELVGPGEFGMQPSPFSRSLFSLAGVGASTVLDDSGKLIINPGADGQGVRFSDGKTPVTRDAEIRPGVKGVLGKESLTLGEIIDAWNAGQRWFDVQPDAQTLTTQAADAEPDASAPAAQADTDSDLDADDANDADADDDSDNDSDNENYSGDTPRGNSHNADPRAFHELSDAERAALDGEDSDEMDSDSMFGLWRDSLFADPSARVRAIEQPGPIMPGDTPAKSEIKAREQLAVWKYTASQQSGNSANYVLSMFDFTGEWAKPWAEAGWMVQTMDIKNGQDIREIGVEPLQDMGMDYVDVVLAAVPCTDFSSAGAKWWADKDKDGRLEASVELARNTLATIEYLQPKVWALENPRGRIKTAVPNLPKERMVFEPHLYGDPFTKETYLYGKFNPSLPQANVHPRLGSKIHLLSSSQKADREVTPEGFAYAFWMANGGNGNGKAGTAVTPVEPPVRMTLDTPEGRSAWIEFDAEAYAKAAMIEALDGQALTQEALAQAIDTRITPELFTQAFDRLNEEKIVMRDKETGQWALTADRTKSGPPEAQRGEPAATAAPAPATPVVGAGTSTYDKIDVARGTAAETLRSTVQTNYNKPVVEIKLHHMTDGQWTAEVTASAGTTGMASPPKRASAKATRDEALRQALESARRAIRGVTEEREGAKAAKEAELGVAWIDAQLAKLAAPAPAPAAAPAPNKLADAKAKKEAPAKDDPAPMKAAAPTREQVRELERSVFRDLSADAALVGKTIEEVEQALRDKLAAAGEAGARITAPQIARMARSLVKDIAKNAAELVKQQNRAPATRERALGDAMATAYPDPSTLTPEQNAAFVAGFDHMLQGKTKSTLRGDFLAEQTRGYQGAQAWAKTPEGRAWYEGTPYAKLSNTGVDLRRHWEELKAKMKAGESDVTKAWKQIERATTRADLFAPFTPASAPPGVKLYVAQVRNLVRPFKQWLQDNHRWNGNGAWRRSEDTDLDYILAGRRYPADLESAETERFRKEDGHRVQWLQDKAAEYITAVRQFTGFLAGKPSVAEMAEAFELQHLDAAELAKIKGEGKQSGYYYGSGLLTQEARKLLSKYDPVGVLGGASASDLNVLRKDSDYTQGLIKDEATIALPKKSDPLTPPKLDRVERSGLPDQRLGQNITPEVAKTTFGFADVGFGSYVRAKQDQDHLNYAYDAFYDLARHFGAPPEAIGFGGQMHLTIGALGHGKFAAHFSPAHSGPKGPVQVINLTNTRGDGTVYHEWTHALDHFMGGEWKSEVRPYVLKVLTRGINTAQDFERTAARFLSGGSYWQGNKRMDKVDSAIKAMRHYRNGLGHGTAYKTNADALGKDYWGNNEELIARASEAWAADTLGGTNTYLVNADWVGDGKVTATSGHRGTPYPTGAERQLFNQLYTALAKATKWEGGKPSITMADLTAALPEAFTAGEARRLELMDPAKMREFQERLQSDADAKSAAQAEDKAAQEAAEAEELERLAAQKLAEIQAATAEAPVVDAPPVGQTSGPLTDADLAALFDEAAAELREAGQEQPDTPLPGEAATPPNAAPTPPNAAATPPNRAPAPARAPATSAEATPTPAEVAPPSASQLIADAAKLGVKGVDEALTGLAKLFGGGPGRLSSFPGGLDEDTYAKAEPHFKAALAAFQAAGKSLKDLFKLLIGQFGDGVKPYAVQFAKDEALTAQLGTSAGTGGGSMAVAQWVEGQLARGTLGQMTWQQLFRTADQAFGGTQAEGEYTPKDAYDALEAGVNRFLMRDARAFLPTADREQALANVAALERLTALLPTQSKRTAEQDEFQQFSTVPALAYAANWAANVSDADTLLEPSAGIGGLAAFAKNAGAKLILNELSSRRAGVLRDVFPGARVFTENAEQIHNILAPELVPSVVVMNPPFSATAGRLQGERNTQVGAQHVEQALLRLAPGGRLVAIVGEGMARDKPAFKAWWAKMDKLYNVRAAIPMDGSGYAKYGTTFNNAILVIDKVAPSGAAVVTTPATTYTELIGLLAEIHNDRPSAEVPASAADAAQRAAAEQELGAPAAPGEGAAVAGQPDADLADGVGGGASLPQPVPGGNGVRRGGGGRRVEPASAVPKPDGRTNDASAVAGGSGDAASGADGRTAGLSEQSGLSVQSQTLQAGALTDSVYENYQPQRLQVPGARPHPGALVQSAAMASVLPPAATYVPNLPAEAVTQGKLSIAQIEAVVYAGQAHSEFLDEDKSGKVRRGFFIGDNTGVGKGREISGVILDNLRQGRTKHVWVSEKQPLMNDAKRDFKGVGGDESLIFNQSKTGAEGTIDADGGILFTTYATLRSGAQSQDFGQDASDAPQVMTPAQLRKRYPKGSTFESTSGYTYEVVSWPSNGSVVEARVKGTAFNRKISFTRVETLEGLADWRHPRHLKPANAAKKDKGGQSRLDQLVAWLGEDFDGVIAFDEAHNAGNAVAIKGERGASPVSQQALAVVELQKRLPQARVVYVSATGATQVANLSFATRLGLWGPGTPFVTVQEFIAQMNAGGLAAMELVARDMKQMGAYIARSLSYDGVTYSRLEHELSPLQRDIYDRMADAWQVTLQNMEEALKVTGAVDKDGKGGGKAKGNAKAAFWGAQQRFFNQVITAMQMPTVLEQIERDVAGGNAVVLQLVNTNEAQQQRALDKQKGEGESEDLEDLDLTPRDQLIQMVEKAFPVTQYEEYRDDEGNKARRPAQDSQGAPVLNREAVAMRDKLIADLRQIRVPDGPLEILLNHFGPDKMAEITGRTQRVVRKPDAEGNIKAQLESRGGAAARADADAFMADKKPILVFSNAGGTGFSFHADLTKPNQRKRKHYLIQPGWQADKAVQGFGRTHRTNQASAPHYYLASTDIPAQKRFLSAIARRLDMLGALTKGQRDTASQGLFSERDNLESKYATAAVRTFLNDMRLGIMPGLNFIDFLRQTGLEEILDPITNQIVESKYPATRQFLNRMLSLNLETQDKTFEAFMQRMDDAVAQAVERGDYDAGMQTVKAQSVRVVNDDVAYTDPRTGAETRLVELELTQPTHMHSFPERTEKPEYVVNAKSGRVYVKELVGTKSTLANGAVVDRYRMRGTGGTMFKDATEFAKRDGKDAYRVVTREDAQALWAQENDAKPATYTQQAHMVVGAMLPIWDRLNTSGTIKVQRAQTDEGKRLLGMVIEPKLLPDLRKRLNIASPAAKLTPAEVMTRVLKGEIGELANGWRLLRARVSNDLRIELKTGYISAAAQRELVGQGLVQERIEWTERFFVPVGVDGVGVLEKLLKAKPLVEIAAPAAPSADASARASRSLVEPGAVLSRTAVQQVVQQVTAGWQNRPPVEVAANLQDPLLPQAVRDADAQQRFGGATGRLEGVFYQGRVYLVASELASPERAAEVLLHEALGHYGLAKVFGKELAAIAKSMATLRRPDVLAKARQYGLVGEGVDVRTASDAEVFASMSEAQKLEAGEEVLAELAQTQPTLGFVRRAVAAIRAWLRQYVPGLAALQVSDDEIVRAYILPAQRFVTRGATEAQVPAASRQLSAAFARGEPGVPGFYSALERALQAVPERLSSRPPSQWTFWLNANKAQLGIKDDELEWSGMADFLALQDPKVKVGRDDLLAFLSANGVQVNEVVNADPDAADVDALLADEVGEGMTRDEAVEYLKRDSGGTRYGNYTLPGGSNYREVLLTLPGKSARDVADANMTAFTDQITRRLGRTAWGFESMLPEEVDEYNRLNDAALAASTVPAKGFQSSHWSEPNIVAHLRVNDRLDADGQRVLFVEELQSDWGQAGKKKGFKPTPAELRAMQPGSPEALLALARGDFGPMNVTVDNGFGQPMQQTLTAQRPRGELDTRLPGAPFVQKTEAWLNLALKRVMQMAVEGGYDRVAFVNGEQSADRYDLSKRIGKLVYDDKYKELSTYGTDGRLVDERLMSMEEAADFVGKDVAKKLSETEPVEGKRTLEGLDLKVGGEGMKAFYDQLVPQQLNKLLAKLAGTKASPFEVSMNRAAQAAGEVDDNGVPVDVDENGVPIDPKVEWVTQTSAQLGFDVTPKLRAAVSQGLPLFSRSAMDSVEVNVRRGREAMNRALLEKADQHRAMFRPGLGWVDFVWGDDKKGLQHVYKQRAAKDAMTPAETTRMLVQDIVEVIARGQEVPERRKSFGLSANVLLRLGNYEAVLVRSAGANTWMLSAWGPRSPGAVAVGYDTATATQRRADSTGAALGAGDASSLAPADEPRFSRSADDAGTTDGESRQRSQPGVNAGRLADLLGPQLYGNMSDMGPVTVKELFQNSFDALKALVEKDGKTDGEISIELDQDARTITLRDNGNGMTPDIINKAFLTMAGTNKETARSSGGFGIAKMLFLMGNESLQLTTVRGGVEARLDTSGAQIKAALSDAAQAPEIVTRASSAPAGTTIVVKVPANYVDSSTGETRNISFPMTYEVRDMLKNSPLFDPITVKVNGDTLDIGAKFNKDNFTTFATVKFQWGVARVIVSKQEDKAWGANAYVLSNGLWQFNKSITENPFEMGSPNVPRKFFINVEPSVKPEESGYPFALNRQDFSAASRADFSNIFNYISVLYGGSKAAENAAGFGQVEYIEADGSVSAPLKLAPELDADAQKGLLRINEGDAIEVVDGRMVVNGREVPQLTPQEIQRARVDASKFKIEQSEVDASRSMIHDNLDVLLPRPESLEIERQKVEREAHYAAKETAQAEIDRLKGQGLSTDSEAVQAARRQRDEAYDRYWAAEEEIERLQAAQAEALKSGTTPRKPLTALARERYGWRFDAYLAQVSGTFRALRDAVADEGGRDYRRLAELPVGVSFDTEYFGVHFMVPFRGMFVNPLLTQLDPELGSKERPNYRLIARSMVGTMIHEIAHYAQMNHSTSFISEMQRVRAVLDGSEKFDLLAAVNQLARTLESYSDVYEPLNRLVRTSGAVENRGVKLADGARYERREGDAADVAGPGAARGDDGRVAGQAGPGAGADAAGREPAGLRGLAQSQRSLDAPAGGEVRFSRSTLQQSMDQGLTSLRDYQLPGGYAVGDFMSGSRQPGTLNWWHKTIGTMYNLARRNPTFGRIFERAQTFINDVSFFANAAADNAPAIVPRVDGFADLAKTAMTPEDSQAMAAPVFEGTLVWARTEAGALIKVDELTAQASALSIDQKARKLLRKDKVSESVLKMWQGLPEDEYAQRVADKYEAEFLRAGVVFTPQELKDQFGLTGEMDANGVWGGQIGLYRQFRRAVDKSLADLSISTMINLAGEDGAVMAKEAMAAGDGGDVVAASDLLTQHLLELSELIPERSDALVAKVNAIVDVSNRAQSLMRQGYAPLSRYGSHTVDAVDPATGERLHFGLYETAFEANKEARKLRAANPQARVVQGTMSQDAYKLYAGVAPETLELFGKALGLNAEGGAAGDALFQQYITLAKSNRSAMKRLIKREGIKGFSQDPGRVLAGFIYSNARQISANLHLGELRAQIEQIPRQEGELKDHAMELLGYIENPQEEAQRVRGWLFFQYLGGSVASALVNMTQVVNVSFPWLSQKAGIAGAARALTQAMPGAMRGNTGEADLDAALKKAAEDGVVAPQEVFYLQAQAAGQGGLRTGDGTTYGNAYAKTMNALNKGMTAWSALFGLAEQFNRRATYIAAYRIGREQGMSDPDAYARHAVEETQFVYSKAAKPRWARGTAGSLLFTFKTYSINYVELLSRLAMAGEPGSPERAAGQRAALLSMAVLFFMAGGDGLPFWEDFEDVVNAILQRMGYNVTVRQKKHEFFTGIVNREFANFMERGVTGMAGVPLDVSGRLGMGNLIPGTGLLMAKDSYSTDVWELFGPAGDLAKRTGQAASQLVAGNVLGRDGALATIAPNAARNVVQAGDMLATDMYRDSQGRKVLDTGVGDALLKGIGFQPGDVARSQVASREEYLGIQRVRQAEDKIADRWAQGIFERDPDKVQAAREALVAWNESNPQTPIRIGIPQIMKRVKAMNMSRAERVAAMAPPEIRAAVRRELAASRPAEDE